MKSFAIIIISPRKAYIASIHHSPQANYVRLYSGSRKVSSFIVNTLFFKCQLSVYKTSMVHPVGIKMMGILSVSHMQIMNDEICQ